jgi:hypothetical protein
MLDTLCGFCKQGVRSSSLLSSTRQNTTRKIDSGPFVAIACSNGLVLTAVEQAAHPVPAADRKGQRRYGSAVARGPAKSGHPSGARS